MRLQWLINPKGGLNLKKAYNCAFFYTKNMKVVSQAVPVIKFSPRFYPDLLDTLVLTLDDGVIIPFTWTILKNNIIATLGSTAVLTQGETYSFTITRGQDIVYKGKIIFVADNTDIQNYSNQSQNTKRWE